MPGNPQSPALDLATKPQFWIRGLQWSPTCPANLAVCHNDRISRNWIFPGLAHGGCTTTVMMFGFKRHVLINTQGLAHGLQDHKWQQR
ncbi:MAG: hypothetical protein F4157_01000 [Synechococcus sp. SB0675_bin_6]|nr:hypothetical protein [Synechococcus sp. SB0675_bin_6]